MASDPISELISALDEAGMLLREANETHWAGWLEKDRRLIASGDFYGVEHLLQAFGGMGSLNDIALADPGKGARVETLLSKIYDHAVTLKRDYQRS